MSQKDARPEGPRWNRNVVFICGTVIWIAVHCFQHSYVFTHRSSPVETDDAYFYIVRSAQMQLCPLQDCPALDTLRTQLLDPQSNLPKPGANAYWGTFCNYFPLYSIALWALHSLGLSWESAYFGIALAGTALISVGLACWVRALWGPVAAGLTMCLLAFNFFPIQGLHYVVPSNICLGLAGLMWANVAREHARHWPLLTVFTVGLVTLHPIGKVYALLGVAAAFLVKRRRGAGHTIDMVGSLLTIVLASLVSRYVSHPEFRNVRGLDFESFNSYRSEVLATLRFGAGCMWDWGAFYGWSLLLPAFVLGVCVVERHRRRSIAVHGILVLMMCVAASLYVVHGYVGEVFVRTCVPAGCFVLAGAVCGLGRVMALCKSLEFSGGEKLTIGTSRFSLILSGLGRYFLMGAIGLGLLIQISISWKREVVAITKWKIQLKDFVLATTNVDTLLASASESSLVGYTDQTLMHYFFAHGALRVPAVYLPALESVRQPRFGMDGAAEQWVVCWNPLVRGQGSEKSYIDGSEWRSVSVKLNGNSVRGRVLRVDVTNQGHATALQVSVVGGGG